LELESLSYEKKDKVAILAMNEPKSLNALSNQMREELAWQIDQIRHDPEVRVLVLTGQGSSFCSGGDLKSVFEMFNEKPAQAHQTVVNFYQAFLSLKKLDIPTIAVVKGHTIGAGLCLAMACDMIIASSDTKMSMSFIKIGIIPGMGGTYALPRLVGTSKALELCLLGDPFDAQEALRIGLVNHVVDADQLMEFSLNFASRIANNPPVSVRFIKKAIYQNLNKNLDEALSFEAFSQIACASTGDMKEAIAAFKEKRPPVFKGI
jgi:enoyl-CoA hydratase/carnithine racemase